MMVLYKLLKSYSAFTEVDTTVEHDVLFQLQHECDNCITFEWNPLQHHNMLKRCLGVLHDICNKCARGIAIFI